MNPAPPVTSTWSLASHRHRRIDTRESAGTGRVYPRATSWAACRAAAVRRAVRLPRELRGARQPGGRQHARRSSSSKSCASPSAIASGSRGSTRTAASPATSGSDETVEVRTGHPRGEPLEHREAEPFVQRRIGQQRGAGQQGHLLPVAHVAGAHDARASRRRQRADHLVEAVGPPWDPSGRAPRRSRAACPGAAIANASHQVLEVLARLDPADEQRVRAVDAVLAPHRARPPRPRPARTRRRPPPAA